MIRETAQAIHTAINAPPTSPTIKALEGILATALSEAVSGHVHTHAGVCAHASMDTIVRELDQMATLLKTCDAIEKAWFEAGRPSSGPLAEGHAATTELGRKWLDQQHALAKAACECESDTLVGVFVQVAFADHLFEMGADGEGGLDDGRFELARSLQHAALRGLLRLGAHEGVRADLVRPFCRLEASGEHSSKA